MATESDIQRELAGEREQLSEAVTALRGELGHAADRGKKIGAAVGAFASLAALAKIARSLRRD